MRRSKVSGGRRGVKSSQKGGGRKHRSQGRKPIYREKTKNNEEGKEMGDQRTDPLPDGWDTKAIKTKDEAT